MNFPLKFGDLTFISSGAHIVAYSYDYSSHTHRKQATGFHLFLSHPNYDLVPFTAFSQAFSDKAAVFLQFPEVKIQNLGIKFNYVTTKRTQHKSIFQNNRNSIKLYSFLKMYSVRKSIY